MNQTLPNPLIPKTFIFGVPFSRLGFRDTLQLLVEAVKNRQATHVITANPIMVTAAGNNPAVMAMMKRAELVVPDGAGVVWAAGYIGQPVTEKVAGIELMEELIRIGEQEGWRVFLLGTSEEVIQAAAARIKDKYPKIQIVGVQNGYFSDEQDDEIVEKVREAKPDLLFVGRSADKQDLWIDRYRDQLDATLMMGVGGSFDIFSGNLKRAPKIFIRMRLEWLYRLMQEPSRYKRMLDLPRFVMKVIKEKDNVGKP
ncbi:WecB/TagA/CpsF family glycosyltransferase [Gorillibacterium massiliense]|uniref:WecB/TagA/CpsF family glycosyltransferase n=1 Tax=Gorillibacterium massiliense TaxID=1280390 RepID=UPI0004BAABFF